jgi:tRNA (guanine37-N1)-methyltransferase
MDDPTPFDVTFVSLFPGLFDGPMTTSIVGRAVATGALRWSTVSPRDFSTDRHRTTDDTPYGGGAGMVMRAPELAAAVRWARAQQGSGAPVVLLTPQGRRFDQAAARALAALPGLILVCGRYEGIDERFVERCVDVELSLGDFVLTGGELAACCVVDAVVRLLPGVLGNDASAVEESFSAPTLEHPQFTRPLVWEGDEVPSVLRGGDHAKIARWRALVSHARTGARRPDLAGDAPPPRLRRGDDFEPLPAWLTRVRGVPHPAPTDAAQATHAAAREPHASAARSPRSTADDTPDA